MLSQKSESAKTRRMNVLSAQQLNEEREREREREKEKINK